MEGRYENYPAWIILVCNLVPVSIYVIGAVIMAGFSPWVSVAYLLFCLWQEVRVMRTACINCFYYGKNCGTGKGRLCALLFKRGNPQAFATKEANWKELLPDLLISLLPLLGGNHPVDPGFCLAAPHLDGVPGCAGLRRDRGNPRESALQVLRTRPAWLPGSQAL